MAQKPDPKTMTAAELRAAYCATEGGHNYPWVEALIAELEARDEDL